MFVDHGGWLPTIADSPNPSLQAGHIIERVIGLPGDHVVCCTVDGDMAVNGVLASEPYVDAGAAPWWDQQFDVVVPPHMLWPMGGHRQSSADSGAHINDVSGGFVPTADVEEIVFMRTRTDGRAHWIAGSEATRSHIEL